MSGVFGPGDAAAFRPGVPSGLPIDAYGNPVYPNQAQYVSMIQTINGAKRLIFAANPNYNPASGVSAGGGGSSPTPVSPQYQATFDTIGQTIYRTLGHCRVPLRLIWEEGVSESDQIVTALVNSIAMALCAPIDPDEEGTVVAVFLGGDAVFGSTGFTAPPNMDGSTAALLNASLSNAIVFPGDEKQLPCPLIIADKGAQATNAFRGIRYIVFPAYPVAAGSPSNLSIQWQRTNDISTGSSSAVEFAAGEG